MFDQDTLDDINILVELLDTIGEISETLAETIGNTLQTFSEFKDSLYFSNETKESGKLRDKLVKQIAKDRADRKDLLSKLTVGGNQAYSKCPNHGVLEGVRYGPHNPAPCGCRFLWIGPDLIAWSDELNKFAPYENPPELSETENFSHVFSARLKKTIDEKTEID